MTDLEQSSAICNTKCVAISADFSEEIEDWLFQRSYTTSSFPWLNYL